MSRLQANILLLLAALVWGLGNIAHKKILTHLDPFAAVGLTCLIGGLVVLPLVGGERKRPPEPGWPASLCRVTALFFVGMVMQQIAYVEASVTNASFLISTYTVMTPAAAWLMFRERPGAYLLLAAAFTLAGSFLMSGGLSGVIARADLLALLAAACFSVWTVELGRHLRLHGRPFTTAATQFLATGMIILPFSAAHGDLPLEGVIASWPELVVLGVFSTGVGFGIQTFAQCYTSASHAAIITSAEAVFAALAAGAWLGERLDVAGTWGACLIFAAVLVVATVGGRAPKSHSVGIP